MTDCSGFLPQSGSFPSQNDLVGFGACAGLNAVQGSSVVQALEADIVAGVVETAALIQVGTTVLSQIGLGAGIGSVAPVVGTAIGVVIGLLTALAGALSEGPQIFVPAANGGQEAIDVSWYPQFVQNAVNWIEQNKEEALQLSPQDFSQQHNIYINRSVIPTIAAAIGSQDPLANPYVTLAKNPPPGAVELLKLVQLPAAAAIAGAAPSTLMFLTSPDNSGRAPLVQQFPALEASDMAAIQSSLVLSRYQSIMMEAQQWADGQCPYPSIGSLQSKFKLPLSDAWTILSNWSNGGCPGMIAPSPPSTITVVKVGGGNHPGSGSGGIYKPGHPETSSSFFSKALIAIGVAGVGYVAWRAYKGHSIRSQLKTVEQDFGKSAHWVEHKLHLRRSNPVSSRNVVYRANLDSGRDRIALTKYGAVFYRDDVKVIRFKASKFQKTKIRSGTGEVLIFADQLE